MCVIPADANIIDYILSVQVAFDDTGTDVVDCGWTWGTPNELFSAANVTTEAIARPGATTALGDIGHDPKTVWCKYTGQNGNSNAGDATLVIYYMVD